MKHSTEFGRVVERICSAKGLTQKDIAEGIGVAAETITRWKTSFSPPAPELLRTLAYLRRFEPTLTAEDLLDIPAEAPSPSGEAA